MIIKYIHLLHPEHLAFHLERVQ
jgi:hypothetical protein